LYLAFIVPSFIVCLLSFLPDIHPFSSFLSSSLPSRYYPFIHAFNKPILGVFSIICAVFIIFAVQIEPESEQASIIPVTNNYVTYRPAFSENFARAGDPFQVYTRIVVGLDSIDRNCEPPNCETVPDPTVPGEYGTIMFDPNFDMSERGSQAFMLNMCRDLREGTAAGLSATERYVDFPINASYAPEDYVTPAGYGFQIDPVICWVEHFRDWVELECPGADGVNMCEEVTADSPGDLVSMGDPFFPIEDSKELIECFQFGSSTKLPRFDCYFIQWMRAPMLESDPLYSPNSRNVDQWSDYLWFEEYFGLIVLRFFYIDIATSFSSQTAYPDGIEKYTVWTSWITAQQQAARSSSYKLDTGALNDMFSTMFVTDKAGVFAQFHLQMFMTQECISGILLSLLIAFVILCFATHNLYLSLFSVATIGLIVCGVVSFTVWVGWKLGVVEAIIFVMVVGMSVDYAVHLSDAYIESKERLRGPRTQDMLTKMGVSIVSGACSTLGMSFFLAFFTFITFFSKIGYVSFHPFIPTYHT
jgi:hypothetical protein